MLLSDMQQQQDARKPGAVRRPPAAPPDTRVTHVEIPIGPREDDQMGDGALLEHAFAKCLGGLVSVVMQEVQLVLAFPTGEITAVYLCGHGQQAAALGGGGDGSAVSVSLGEKYAEDIRFVCMILSIRKDSVAHLHQPSLVLLQQMLTPTVRNQRN
jgi:hypothetical protein